MKLKFLGTGGAQGVPVWDCDCVVCQSSNSKDKRLRSSVLLEIEDTKILLDFGPDCRTQLLKYGIKDFQYAFLTHAHRDHMNGSIELSRPKNLTLEMPAPVLEEFDAILRSHKVWLEKRNPTIKIQEFKPKTIHNVKIDTVKLEHQKDYEKTPFPCYGYIFQSDSFKIAYMSDYNAILEEDKLQDLDLLISDGNGFENRGWGHVGIKDGIKVFQKLKPKKMLFTHINHKKSHDFLTEYVKKFGNIEIAYDGQELTF